jgi:hypothetical protein
MQPDVQQAAVALATEVPYETAAMLFGRLSGLSVRSERMHTFTHQVAEGLSVVDVAPSREELDRRVAQVAAGRFRRPVLVLGLDGAYVPSRPERVRGRRPGRARDRPLSLEGILHRLWPFFAVAPEAKGGCDAKGHAAKRAITG